MKNKNYNRKSVKSDSVIDYLSQHGDTKAEVLASELGVSKSLAAKNLRNFFIQSSLTFNGNNLNTRQSKTKSISVNGASEE